MIKTYDYDDFTIIPARVSEIESRNEINILVDGKLPLITAPMDTLIDEGNKAHFRANGIGICLPRGVKGNGTDECESISLKEAMELAEVPSDEPAFICIDIANGHMKKLKETIEKLLLSRPNVKLIVGNIANGQTFEDLALPNVWGIRVGIGAGNACTTSANAAVHCPMGSLVFSCYEIKREKELSTRIIADGGIRKMSDIIKALALGADVVMIGSLFNKMLQSNSIPYLCKLIPITNPALTRWLFKKKFPLYKKYRGMSTKEVQIKWKRDQLRTAEGISLWNKLNDDLYRWTGNFSDYLRSSMSYTNSRSLDEFKECHKILISQKAFERFNK